jgi:PHD/YefM family antitoxin component YafN of YafNO toxin-antitoxin module
MSSSGQYITDENGNKVAVILPLTEYEHMKKEDLHDLARVAERRDEGTLSLAELKKRVMCAGTDESIHALF